jgi:uncharacterized protein
MAFVMSFSRMWSDSMDPMQGSEGLTSDMEEYVNGKSRFGSPIRRLAAIGTLAVLAVTLAGSIPSAGAQDATPVSESTTATVTVQGVGIVTTAPDTASVQLGVTVTEDTLAAAQSKASTQMAAIIEAVKTAGVDDKDIQTSNYYVSVQQNYDEMGNPTEVVRFQVSNQVNVTIRDVAKVGQILDDAVAAGANTIYGVNFYVDDPKALSSKARKLAVDDARTRASELATAAGLSLGRIVSITEGYSSGPVYGGKGGAGAAAAEAAPPIETGSATIQVDVTVVFELV